LLEFNRNLDLIKNNKNQKLREEWLKRAAGLEEEVVIKQDNKTARGIFIGIDENMSLLLKQNNNITKFVVGDVFLKKDIVNDGI
jgi:biotin-(acetyl-CoA carboxylase) ligase